MKPEYKIIAHATVKDWRQWLEENHHQVEGVWLRIYKKASNTPTVSYAEALDEALCFGWIDGQRKSYDAVSFIQKFTPRRARSLWSKRNIEYVERLTAAGLMTAAGIAEVERAKADGRWAAAYDKPSDMQIPSDFLNELRAHPKAAAFYKTLKKSDIYAIAWRLQTAKTEKTRQRRLGKIITSLDEGVFV